MQCIMYLEIHEVHKLGDFWLQDLNCLLIDLNSVGLFIALHLKIKPRKAFYLYSCSLTSFMQLAT